MSKETGGWRDMLNVVMRYYNIPVQYWEFSRRRILLSHFSHVQLLCDPTDDSPPGSPSLGFSRQEHWSGLPFPSPMRESEVAQSCPTLSDPMDCSLLGSSIHGIFQARVLEWSAIAFSMKENKWWWKREKNSRNKWNWKSRAWVVLRTWLYCISKCWLSFCS